MNYYWEKFTLLLHTKSFSVDISTYLDRNLGQARQHLLGKVPGLLVGGGGEGAGTRLAVPGSPAGRQPIEARQAALTVVPGGVVSTRLGHMHEKKTQLSFP